MKVCEQFLIKHHEDHVLIHGHEFVSVIVSSSTGITFALQELQEGG